MVCHAPFAGDCSSAASGSAGSSAASKAAGAARRGVATWPLCRGCTGVQPVSRSFATCAGVMLEPLVPKRAVT